MAFVTRQVERTNLPAPGEIVPPNAKWLARGLKSLYLLTPELWQTNLVTGKLDGRPAGTGVTFPNRKLYTPGTTGNGAYLAHGLALNVSAPVTLVIGCTHLTGAVDWSILSSASTQWSGWYGQATGVTTSALNSFDGLLGIGGSVAVTHDSSTSLRGSNGGAVLTDTSATFPAVNAPDITLGWSKRSTGDNPAIAEFTHFAAIQGSLSNAELIDLARNPGQLFEPITETIWLPDAVASGAATVIPIGVQAPGSVGAPTATGAANATPAGVSATSAAGTPVAVGGASIPATALPAGIAASASVGTPVTTGAALASPAGVAAASAVGTPAAIAGTSIPSTALPVGVSAAASVGSNIATGAAWTVPGGVVAATSAVGTPTAVAGVSGAATVQPLGVSATSAVGTLTATGAAFAYATGVQAVAIVGSPIGYGGAIYVPGAIAGGSRSSNTQSGTRAARLQTSTRAAR